MVTPERAEHARAAARASRAERARQAAAALDTWVGAIIAPRANGRARIGCLLTTADDMEARAVRANRWYERAPRVRAEYHRRRRARRSGRR